jgi:hypothetical protein
LASYNQIEQMDSTWSAGGQADTYFAGELGMGASHECRHLLVADLDIIYLLTCAPDSANDAIDAVAGKSVNAPNSPFI